MFCGENHSCETAAKMLEDDPEARDLLEITTVTLDFDEKCHPDLLKDILQWEPLQDFKPGEFDLVWASIPCQEYSRAKTTAPRDLESADAVGRATVQAILDLAPAVFVIENPNGLLRHRDYMQPLLKYLKPTTYCVWGFPYKKETDIFTNIEVHLPHCRLVPCEYFRKHGRHAETAQRGNSKNGTPGNSVERLHRVPHGLIIELLKHAFIPSSRAPKGYLPEDLKRTQA